MDRPHTMKSGKSGVALQSNYSVHHRSDILMEEQIEAVRKSQEDLKKALSDLESAKSENDIDKCRTVVQESKEKSEKAILVLQVLTKVNTELQFARAELDEALEKQEGDINEARKRVMWLEDRMGILCGKARLRVQVNQKQRTKSFRSPERSYRSRLGSATDSEDSDFGTGGRPQFIGRTKSIEVSTVTTRRAGMYSPSESGSDYPPYHQQHRAGLADTPSSGAESFMLAQQKGIMKGPRMMQGPGMGDSDSDSDDDGMPAMMHGIPGMPPIPGSSMAPPQQHRQGSAISGTESEYSNQATSGPQPVHDGEGYSVIKQEETVQDGDTSRNDDAESREGVVIDADEASQNVVAQFDDDHIVKDDVKDETQVDKVVSEDQEDEDEGDKNDEDIQREQSEVSETASTYSEVSRDPSLAQSDPAFMTEVSYLKERSVTIQTPRHSTRRVKDQKEDSKVDRVTDENIEDIDQSRDYWLSEHHRFEYSQYSEVLLELDPLSYHSVGLAMPGTFIDKPSKSYESLPWRIRRKGSDINDIHKIALDKLAGRVHTMYDKFYDAALLSVKPTQNNQGIREPTMFSNIDTSRDGVRSVTPTDSRPGMMTAPPTTADGLSRPQTVSKEIAPIKLRPGLNVYHPKPIPPPEVLPLTRTSKDKEYPRLSSLFCEESDGVVNKPAIRIVDQRNLHKETKLKLYRDKPKRSEDGPSTTEKKFRMMLEQEKSMASRSSRSSRQTTGKGTGTRMSMNRTLTKAENHPESEVEVSTWSRLKPSSRGKEYGGLKWERVKTMVHVNLVSKRTEERQDAAKHLGLLRCGDAMVFYALKERLRVDEDSRVKYEAAKSLILLGCWDEDVLQVILMYLVVGNTEIREDLILNMIDGKNVQYVNKKIPTFPELVKVLSHFCRNPDPEDTIAFDAAVLLGKLCVMDDNAKYKLLRSLEHSNDTHVKAKALEVLTKQLNCTNWEVVQHLLSLFQESPVWKYRALAADLLIVLGKANVCKRGEEERIYQILERKLWDDPNKDVRVSAAKALAALGMFSKACDRIEKRLEDTDEDIRAQAVISVGTLEMKNEKIIRLLLEMLELDASEYVRLMIARTFTILKLTDKRVFRALRERDKVEGALARESRKALKVLESLATQVRLMSPIGRKSMDSRGSAREATPRFTPAVTA
ncbi:HEAT repeat containing 9 [Mactra antiquata]